MKWLASLVSIVSFFGLGGCASTRVIEKPDAEPEYSFSIEIPVVRPSSWDRERLLEAARELSESYRTANIVFGFERDSDIPRLNPTNQRLADGRWLWFLKAMGRWHVKDWNFDPGTTARISLRRGGVGAYYLGNVVFIRGGKELRFRAIGGNSHLIDYYRAMAKLGIYIP